jgi:hypothetical protein
MCIICAEVATGVVTAAAAVINHLRCSPYRRTRDRVEESVEETLDGEIEVHSATCPRYLLP